MPPAVDPRMARRRGGRGRKGGGARSMKRPAARGTFGSEVRALLTPPQRPAARGRSGGCGAASVSSDASHRCAGRLGGCSVFFVPSDVPPRRAQGVRVIVARSSSRRMWGSTPPLNTSTRLLRPVARVGFEPYCAVRITPIHPQRPVRVGFDVLALFFQGGDFPQRPARVGFDWGATTQARGRSLNAPRAWGSMFNGFFDWERRPQRPARVGFEQFQIADQFVGWAQRPARVGFERISRMDIFFDLAQRPARVGFDSKFSL